MNEHVKKMLLGFGILVLVIVFFEGSMFIQTGMFAQTLSQEPESIKIGVITPLTGNYATLGNNLRNGMELAKSNLEKDDSHSSIQLVFEDACQPKDTLSAFNKLTTVDNIDLLGESFCVVGFVPLIPLAEDKNLISFSVAASPTVLLNKPYVFSLNKAIKSDANDIVVFARDKLQSKRIAIVFYNTQLGVDYNTYLSHYFTSSGGTLVGSYMTELDRTDFRTELSQIKDNNADIVVIIQLANSLGAFLRQAKEQGITASIMSQSTAEDPTVISSAQGSAEGLIISSSQSKYLTPEMKKFNEEYLVKFGKKPDVIAAISYDSLIIEINALKKCKKDPTCLRNEFLSIKNYAGVSGVISMNLDGSTNRAPNFKIVKNGEFVSFS